MKQLFTAFFILCTFYTSAQNVTDLNGRVYKENKSNNVQGTPYFLDDWSETKIVSLKGQIFEDLKVKYDLVNKLILYKLPSGEVMELNTPVREFTLTVKEKGNTVKKLFRTGYPATQNNGVDAIYEVIHDGKVQFLKHHRKIIFEQREYNGQMLKTYQNKNDFYLFTKNEAPKLITKDAKSIISTIGDQTEALNAFVKKQKLNLKNEEDVIKLLTFYQSLSTN